jgi:hypothetical protein
LLHIVCNDIKGKDVPANTLKAYVGEELLIHSFLTSVLDAGEWSKSHFNHLTPSPKTTQIPLKYEAGWATDLVSTLEGRKIFLT